MESEREHAQQQLTSVSNEANKVGLEINVAKTKQMVINPDYGPQLPLELNEERVEIVNDFKYLGSMVASTDNDIKVRKGQAWAAFWKLKNIWQANNISIDIKLRLFQASCLSILLYGSETWTITEYHRKTLDSFATNCYRIMLKIKRIDKISNDEIYKRVNRKPLTTTIFKRQLEWVGHMLRRDTNEPIRKYALYQPPSQLGKARKGRQPLNFIDHIANLIISKTNNKDIK